MIFQLLLSSIIFFNLLIINSNLVKTIVVDLSGKEVIVPEGSGYYAALRNIFSTSKYEAIAVTKNGIWETDILCYIENRNGIVIQSPTPITLGDNHKVIVYYI